jgi:hypothetical protein
LHLYIFLKYSKGIKLDRSDLLKAASLVINGLN